MGYRIKKIYVWTQQVRPASWNPWANTVAYYPLTSNANDMVGNYNLSAYAGITYSSDWALLPNTTASTWMKEPDGMIDTSLTWTISYWEKPLWASPWWYDGRWIDLKTTNNRLLSLWSSDSQMFANANFSDTATITETTDVWYNHVITISNWAVNIYTDWNQTPTLTTSITWDSYNFRWGQEFDNSADKQFYWYLKDIIIENVVWSTQDISNYYNLMKWEYGKS